MTMLLAWTEADEPTFKVPEPASPITDDGPESLMAAPSTTETSLLLELPAYPMTIP